VGIRDTHCLDVEFVVHLVVCEPGKVQQILLQLELVPTTSRHITMCHVAGYHEKNNKNRECEQQRTLRNVQNVPGFDFPIWPPAVVHFLQGAAVGG
jgi:hypothetical protein